MFFRQCLDLTGLRSLPSFRSLTVRSKRSSAGSIPVSSGNPTARIVLIVFLPTMNRRILFGAAGAVLLLLAVAGGTGAWFVFATNTPDYSAPRTVTLPDSVARSLDAVSDALTRQGILASEMRFETVATATGWDAQIKPGHYRFAAGASTYDLLDVLRKGLQAPVRVTIPPGTRPEVVAAVMGRDLKQSKADFLGALRDTSLAKELGTEPQHLFGYMMPETYEFYWQTPPDRVVRRVKQSFDQFFERELAGAADSLGLTKAEVVTLASIVEEEALLDDEKPTIAGVYLNRLDDNWRLQADPTVIYALIDEGGERPKRVLNKHLEVQHPYNTYVNRGLPPGPITNPSPSSLRAVAAAPSHDYYFFVADGSGGHQFSETLREHNRKAREWYRWLNEQQRKKRDRESSR